MSMLAAMMCGASSAKTYVEDVFSTYLYTGNGSTQTITNGIDLAGKGGLVWTKQRSSTATHRLTDTVRGHDSALESNSTASALPGIAGISSFSGTGYSITADSGFNTSLATYASWTFRKAPKFFSQATATVTGGADATVSFSDLSTLGMVIAKRTDSTGSWYVWHRSLSAGKLLYLEQTAAEATLGHITVSGTTVTLEGGVIANGTYVIYGFAHDTSADGLIQCGSVMSDSNRDAVVNLPWESQFVLFKRINNLGDWAVVDSMRGFLAATTGTDQPAAPTLKANTSGSESAAEAMGVFATGFKEGRLGAAGDTYIYLAIRRPNKPPTTGTQVYSAIARTGTGAAANVSTGFNVDLLINHRRTGPNCYWEDRLRGLSLLYTTGAGAEVASSTSLATWAAQDGFSVGTDIEFNGSGSSISNHAFRRAPVFMDVVCYTGTSIAHTVAHSLQAAPEMVVVKSRSSAYNWWVWHKNIATTEVLKLNGNDAKIAVASAFSSGGTVTDTVFPVGTYSETNNSGATFVAYLWATCSGVSKVGGYSGNGGTLNVECGFMTGARFVMIKRTDSTGDWYVWDVARGIIAANDPHLSMNSSAAEVTTDDSIDPYSTGFTVNQNTATNINVNAATYIFLAIS